LPRACVRLVVCFHVFSMYQFFYTRYDLLKDIQRSTRGGGSNTSLADQAREMDTMRGAVAALEGRVQELESRWQELSLKMVCCFLCFLA